MRLLLCCLAFASVVVSFGMAKNLSKLLGILRSATKYEGELSDFQLTPEEFFEEFGNAKRFSEHVFRTLDSDKSGRVDIKELLLVTYILVEAKPEEKLEWTFPFFDVNGDGTIERSELADVIGSMDEMAGPSRTILDPSDTTVKKMREFLAKTDENNDGVISKDEFFKGSLADESISQMLNENFAEEFE